MGGLIVKYCDKCKVNVRGIHENCPLCQRELNVEATTQEIEEREEVFPYIPTIYKRHHMLFKLINFICIATSIICVALNILIGTKHWWSVFVIAGVGCFWISFILLVKKRNNVLKTILYQVVSISLITVVWDYLTGWYGWSVDFVIPGIGLIDLLVLYILSKVLSREDEDGYVYVIIGEAFGLIPMIFFLFGWLNHTWPSIICITTSILFFFAGLIFKNDKTKEELSRRLHY